MVWLLATTKNETPLIAMPWWEFHIYNRLNIDFSANGFAPRAAAVSFEELTR